ncbi:MAG TPA: tRNA (guanosine(37)-N1)-methyltransferase TrmD [Candidatus Paceibacterota bacterium]|jgi:tRNA (guanine37-N1)-methyltransferase|nr:tRNA (guanosine(37)-N1)-methyltransferase TrmD [Candidatus Paceibacterota bacterium]
MFDSYLKESILGRAIKLKKISVSFINPRKFATGKYKKIWPDGNMSLRIDDRPYAGGPGMVMMAEPIINAVESVRASILKRFLKSSDLLANTRKIKKGEARLQKSFQNLRPKTLVINFVPSAEKFTTALAKNFSKKYTDIIMICGRYEGIDARVDKILKDSLRLGGARRISIGDYVLTGGEIPAMVLIDSISRQVKGVLGNFDSREEERISSSEIYTKPEILIYNNKKYKVPKVLLSGDRKKIEEWKNNKNQP